MISKSEVIKGREVVCPDGIGRISDYSFKFPNTWVQVTTYFDNRDCKWDPKNVSVLEKSYEQ